MLINTHSWFSLNHGVLSPEQVLQEAHALGLQQVALTDINCTAGWSDFFRLAAKYKVRPLAGIEFRTGPRLLYIGIARSNTGVHQLASLLTDHLLDGLDLPERAPELDEAFIIYPFGAAHMPEKLRANEYIGVRPGEVNRLRFSPWMKHKDRLLALAPATFRSNPALAKRDFNVHRLKRAVDTNTLLSTTPPEHVASPDERFLSEEQLCSAFAAVPELVWNTRRLMDQCEVHFAHGKSKNRRTWSADAAADLELLRRETKAGLLRRFPSPPQQVMDRVERELTVIAQKDFVSYFLINWDLVRFAKSRGFFHVGRGSGANSLVAYCLGITDVDPIELDLYFERFINPSRSSPPDFDLDFSWKDRDEVTRYLFDKYGDDRRVALLATYSTYQYRAVIRELGKVFGLPPHEIDALAEGDTGRSVWIGRHAQAGPAKQQATLSQNDRIAHTILRYAGHFHEHPHHLSIHVGGVLISEKPLTHYTALHLPPKGFATTQFSMLEAEDLGLYKFDILSQRGLGHIRDAVEMVGAVVGCQLSGGTGRDSACARASARQCLRTGQRATVPAHGPAHDSAHPPATVGTVRAGHSAGALSTVREGPCAGTFQEREDLCNLTTDNGQPTTAIDIHAIERFKHDPRINELLRTGDTIGCFYVESPAMRMLLKKLGVQDYPTLVAASSIIRPGVAQSGMMREYILRHRDPERRKQAHPAMAAIMPDTYGVMVYQEDVIKVAHLYAGLTLAEADILRRGMSGKYRSREEFQRVKDRFFSNCKMKGYPEHESAEIWRQIESFAGYSFAKGHSASYAVESYQSLYLKAYHPLEFMVAVANNFGGFYHTEFYLHEAKRAGAVVEAPCINRSEELCTLQKVASSEWRVASKIHLRHSPLATHHSPLIFLGFRNIKSLEASTADRLLAERRRNGPFADLPDLLKRVPISPEQARILIRVGALRFTGRSKPQLLWDLTLLHPGAKHDPVPDLFVMKPPPTKLPTLEHFDLSDAYDELELLGFPLCDPFLLVEMQCPPAGQTHDSADAQDPHATVPAHKATRDSAYTQSPRATVPARVPARDSANAQGLRATVPAHKATHDSATAQRIPATVGTVRDGNCAVALSTVRNGPSEGTVHSAREPRAQALSTPSILARDMPRHIGKRVSMLGYVVHVKPTKTGAGDRMSFGSFIDQVGDFWDSTQFPSVEAKYPFRGRGVYRLTGKVEEEFGHCALNVEHVEKLLWKQDPRYGTK
ncbi:MAG: DNA polymerase III subunit alpha [Flavobacteriales bacterium]|nr:DNA polymerase III subunit alpha [Flavobacteriales bacterium]